MSCSQDGSTLKSEAAGIEHSLDQLLQLQSKVGGCLSQIKQLELSNEDPAQASCHESLRLQLSLLAGHCTASVNQLSCLAPALSSAVDALTPAGDAPPTTCPAAAATDGQTEVAAERRPSYRLVHRSGNAPIHQGAARLRLSRDALSNVFGHLQPWELTRYRRPLGTPLFHQSAANYTKLVIDWENDTARPMWAAMPLPVAHRWGRRSINIREVKHRHPEMGEGWCRGTWASLVEGHASGRVSVAEKKIREREGGEGTAAAAAGGHDGDDPDDEGTLAVLSFDRCMAFGDISRRPPSHDLPPAPAAPVHLPALKTVANIPDECASARAGRNWRTRGIKTLGLRRFGHFPSDGVHMENAKARLADCGGLEVLDVIDSEVGCGEMVGALSELPPHSLSGLRTLRGLAVAGYPYRGYWQAGSLDDIDRLREVLVARGVKRSIRELKIDIGEVLRDTDEHWEILQKTAQLVEAVAHPDALSQHIMGFGYSNGEIDAEILSTSRSSLGTPTAQRTICECAKVACIVTYRGFDDEAHSLAVTDDTFPTAHTLRLAGDALANNTKKKRVLEVASRMPNLYKIEGGDEHHGGVLNAPVSEVWQFLHKLQKEMTSRGRERSLDVELLSLSASAFTVPLYDSQSPCLWGGHYSMTLEEVIIYVSGGVAAHLLETLYQHVMAMVTSFNDELKGHKRTIVEFNNAGVSNYFRHRFLVNQAALNLSGGPYKLSHRIAALCVERRDTLDGGGLVVERGDTATSI
ncbi:unnamed protein product [Vitrella brassicaformis CCMP3155]|uniref:Uncharacterized protein n=2 Tax=Vitrella brassicaformis TaxID=1169539 RepID=A0A0G4EJ97_VITBC|nr:unnamed protein product [Vitrella brassicaformis CCMP3155]|eukprot:CEL96789.1 unnamed protein product [Vitrella brassicaformis CCMP3155]